MYPHGRAPGPVALAAPGPGWRTEPAMLVVGIVIAAVAFGLFRMRRGRGSANPAVAPVRPVVSDKRRADTASALTAAWGSSTPGGGFGVDWAKERPPHRQGPRPSRSATGLAVLGDRRMMTGAEASQVGTQLDEDHAPETNGRMSVCRRCGARTDGPVGLHHRPDERELPRSTAWLIAEAQRRRLDHIRRAFRR
jgi:hypothetical protein